MQTGHTTHKDAPINQPRLLKYAMTDAWIINYLHVAEIGHIATHWDEQPFITPSTFWFDDGNSRIYFHSNKTGRVRANADRHPEVCFEASSYGDFLPSNTAMEFSMQYESVVVFGKISLVDNEDEKFFGLYGLIRKYFPNMNSGKEYRPITRQELEVTSLYRIEIESWSGKRNWKNQANQSKDWEPLSEEILSSQKSIQNNLKRENITSYRVEWQAEFNTIARDIRDGLGALALRIDHIGSTAVPGLDAKDRIDIQLTVKKLNNEVEAALDRIGYFRYRHTMDHCPPGMEGSPGDWVKWLFKPPEGQRPTNLHVRVLGKPNQRYPLLFRDYLRVHPATAQAYAELKKRLAENLADGNTYPDVKDPAVDLIYFAAEDWAQIVNWSPGPSDA